MGWRVLRTVSRLGTAIPIVIPTTSVAALARMKRHGGIHSFAQKPVVLSDTVICGCDQAATVMDDFDS